jgi:sugar transferase EpsL
VLLGEMSLVGPRPLLPQYLPWYSPREATRHDVRPGITGWAQINGRNAIAWDRRLELDAWYVENVSAWLDLKIAIATIAKVVRRSGVQADNSAMLPLDVERRAGTLESDARNAA